MPTWWFVRHGESVANAEGWLSGHRDVVLTDRGEAQARRVGRLLQDKPFVRAFSSDLQRAQRTAEIVIGARRIPLQIAPELRERNLGTYEGRDRAQLKAEGRFAMLLTWDQAPPGGESHLDLARRVLPWLTTVDDEQDTLVVSHGGMIRTIVGLLDGDDPAELGRHHVHNCAPIRREVALGTWERLRAHVG